MPKVIDLFCGIGGLSHGFLLENYNVVAGFDIDETCRYAYETNNRAKFVSKDIAEVSGNELKELFGQNDLKVLVGCAPCQPFSSYTFKNKEKVHKKWNLLYEFARLVRETQPDIISMENVAQLLNFQLAPVFEDFVNELKALDYHVHSEIVHCPDYGIPQNRKRLVLLASKLGPIKLIPKTHSSGNYVTVRDTIEHLPEIEDGEMHTDDPLHFSRKLSALNKERIKHTPYGGSWKNWPEELKLECHKKESGQSYPSVYGRMVWEQPAPTVTTHCVGYGNGRFGHPVQDRAISLREAALFQTFPQDYQLFDPTKSMSTVVIARQLGNAVPVLLGQVIAQSISHHLQEFNRNLA
jgi:DNA (cytosine-5)-methyltransferase 1